MTKNLSLKCMLKALWEHISKPDRHQLYLLLMLMVLTALAEMVGIGTILPFLSILMSPESVFVHPLGQWIASSMNLSEPQDLLFPITIFFISAILLAAGLRLLLVWLQTKVAYSIGAKLALGVYSRTLCQPYIAHTRLNSSEVINDVYNKASGISSYIVLPCITMISSIIMIVAILVVLVAVDPVVSIIALGGFAAIYGGIAKLTHRRLLFNSRRVVGEATKVIQSLQEGLGGIRDVLLDHSQAIYCAAFQRADLAMRSAQINSTFIAQSPRFGIEAMGMLLMVVLAYQMARAQGGMATAMPLLGALALGAQRTLPLLQQAFQAWSTIRANQASLADTLATLNTPAPVNFDRADLKPLPYESTLQLEGLWFRYRDDADWVLKDVSLLIPKGAKVGFIGATGCGKSTLLDILMALLRPSMGRLLVDGVPLRDEDVSSWQLHVAHVPQAVFLADTSVARNIALEPDQEVIDMERVREAARRAQLLDTIESWPDGFDTKVGERGVRLSGGQRQRIGIARALYKNADILVFDEATSALDSETEEAVMESIRALGSGITVLIIAHRTDTLSSCDLIIDLSLGEVAHLGSYQEIIMDKRSKYAD